LCRHDRGHRPPSSSTWWRRDPSQRCSAGACLCWHGPSQWPSPLPQGSSPGRAWRGFRAGVGRSGLGRDNVSNSGCECSGVA
jgi:hypothetical protein